MKKLVVGTKNSISAFAIDQGWRPVDYIAITSPGHVLGLAPDHYGPVFITYGFKTMRSSEALGISDRLTAAGFNRNLWRYV
jgi:hypothetical protein